MSNKKDKQPKNKNILLNVITIILRAVGLAALLMMILVGIDIHAVDKHIVNLPENEKTDELIYYTVQDVYEKPEEFIGTYKLIGGYFCKEFATNTGLAWLTTTKETSKDDAKFLIRLEQENEIDYTPKAIAVYGKVELADDGTSLVIKDGQFYLYGGTDKEMLKYNVLIDADIVKVVMTALKFDDNTDITEDIRLLESIACEYEDEDLENILTTIENLASQKESLSQEQFEAEAEQLWNNFRAQLLDR